MALNSIGRLGSAFLNLRGLVSPVGIKPLEGALTQVRTFKEVDVLAKRCKDCYFHRDDYRRYVLCRTHPRHKQRQKVADVRNFWIVTHRTHGPKKRF